MKINREKYYQIKWECKKGGRTQECTALVYGVSPATVSRIKHSNNLKHYRWLCGEGRRRDIENKKKTGKAMKKYQVSLANQVDLTKPMSSWYYDTTIVANSKEEV